MSNGVEPLKTPDQDPPEPPPFGAVSPPSPPSAVNANNVSPAVTETVPFTNPPAPPIPPKPVQEAPPPPPPPQSLIVADVYPAGTFIDVTPGVVRTYLVWISSRYLNVYTLTSPRAPAPTIVPPPPGIPATVRVLFAPRPP
jgi:hypothetical protein